MNKQDIIIRPTNNADAEAIWNILKPVIRAGDTYTFPQDMSEQAALAYWLANSHQVFVATINDKIIGTYYIHPNNTGGGAHIANCGYMTSPEARGKGIARAMCIHSQEIARASGYKAIQFNFVVVTNIYAIKLWKNLGFETVGRLPEVFNHPDQGMVDALVMLKKL